MTLTARCDRHTDTPTRPRDCAICTRIAIERRLVRATVRALLGAGYLLNIDNGGDGLELPAPSADRTVILAELMNTDYDTVWVYAPAALDRAKGWLTFVYGNDGPDVINDYTTNLDTVLDPVNQLAEALAG